jgi:hypothetical protein
MFQFAAGGRQANNGRGAERLYPVVTKARLKGRACEFGRIEIQGRREKEYVNAE